jgi:hypothetical protein
LKFDAALLLGILIGVVGSIVGNLLTPFVKPVWMRLVILQQHGYQASVRQQIKVLQNQIDQLNRRKTGSDRDLVVYLFQWLLAIFSVFVLAVTCYFLAVTAPDATDLVRRRLLLASEVCLVGAIVLCGAILAECRYLSEKGMQKRTVQLETEIAKLNAKLL